MTLELASQEEHAATGAPLAFIDTGELVGSALAEVSTSNARITELAALGRELAARYKDVVADVSTVKGYAQIAGIRTELRDSVRYPLQKLQKAGSKILGSIRQEFNARAEALIAEAESHEKPFQALLDAEDARKADEKAERERREQARKNEHLRSIGAITATVTSAVGLDSGDLHTRLAAVMGIIVDESYEEYQGQAQQAKDEAVRQLAGMLLAARAEELERAEIEETRRQQAAFAAQQAAQAAALAAEREAFEREKAAAEAQREQERQAEQARMDAQRAELEAQQRALDEQRQQQLRAQAERAEAVQGRIDGLAHFGAAYSSMAASGNIEKAIHELQDAPVTPALYDGRMQEASFAKADALAALEALYGKAREREAEEQRQREEQERQQRAAAIEQEIADIRAIGKTAMLAVQDGSAELAGLRKGLSTLESYTFDLKKIGARFDEACLIRDAATADVLEAIAKTEARDLLRAEEEERQLQQNAETTAARALADAKRAHGEELYEVVRSVACQAVIYEHHELAGLLPGLDAALTEARALLVKIDPTEDFSE